MADLRTIFTLRDKPTSPLVSRNWKYREFLFLTFFQTVVFLYLMSTNFSDKKFYAVCPDVDNIIFMVKKVKYPRYRPTWPRGFQEVKAPRFHDTRHTKVVRSSPLRTGTHF